jgi:multidrug efflux pump
VRWLVIVVALALGGSAALLLWGLPSTLLKPLTSGGGRFGTAVNAAFGGLPAELAPKEDPGFIFVFGIGPEGATLEYMDKYARQIEEIYNTTPEIGWNFTFIGWPLINNIISFPKLTPWDDRTRSAQDIMGELYGRFMGIPGILAFPNVPPALGGGFGGGDLDFVVLTSESYESLNQIQQALVAEIQKNPRILNPHADLEMNKPELRIDVNRDKAATVGADVSTVGRALETLMGGRQVTRFKRGAEQYDVILQMQRDQRSTPEALTDVYVRGIDGQIVKLANVVDVSENVAPCELSHFNKLRATTISMTLAPGYALGDAISYAAEALKRVAGDRAAYDLSGQAREFRTASSAAGLLFLLALVFIFLVLAAQFESFIDPFVILLSVPLAVFGALLTLKLTGGTWNIYSQIGVVTLIGLISKHGILIVEFANQMVEAGRDRMSAALEAATLRLRPILMTTGAMVLGAVPLALATGAGANARQQIGWTIVGGMTVGTLFTLFVVPTVYTLVSRHHRAEQPAATLVPAAGS